MRVRHKTNLSSTQWCEHLTTTGLHGGYDCTSAATDGGDGASGGGEGVYGGDDDDRRAAAAL